MAIYNEILAPRFAAMVKKVFAMKGPNPTKQLAGEVSLAFPIFNGAETRFLETWNRFGAAITQAAVAAQNANIRLRNPVGSNVVAVFEKVMFWGVLADQPTLAVAAQGGDLTTSIALSNNRFDNRGASTPTLVASRQGGGFLAPTQFQGAFNANASLDVIVTDIDEFPLLPGDGLTVCSNVVNQIFNAVFWWRERFLEESERQ